MKGMNKKRDNLTFIILTLMILLKCSSAGTVAWNVRAMDF
jgi:hypothetical protein